MKMVANWNVEKVWERVDKSDNRSTVTLIVTKAVNLAALTAVYLVVSTADLTAD